ncbi:Protein N-acetyltransferase, RimJ/RimL family [Agrococcus baldri]|uniref:Protein N-acetyltransferase, RimJ/RimL family n=1 Tax=Agrococcus baldri TaxID=153730 RepID=A0AA94HKT6_9MICO|nr:GNAT family N-acetyltransferase [Agrococcus baldri]SFS01003.1 Protein N-acetyltransferase, RimJ/RimL family [Agrococcus baldri]
MLIRPAAWPRIERLRTARLSLDPLRVDDADALVPVLGDAALYEYTGGEVPSLEQLRRRYTAQVVGQSSDGAQWWLNWVISLRASGEPVGYVQASVEEQSGARVAEVAWVVGVAHQGRGLAVEAAAAMVDWLTGQEVRTVVAHVHPQHEASMRVASRLGLERTERWQDGEVRWERAL